MKIYSRTINILLSLLLLFTVSVSPSLADNKPWTSPEILITFNKKTFLDPDFLEINILAKATTDSFNAVEIILSFEPDFLEFSELNYDNSFCSIIATSSFDNIFGQVRINCGDINANQNTESHIASIIFTKKQSGFSKFSFNNSSLLSADGQGKNIIFSYAPHYVYLVK